MTGEITYKFLLYLLSVYGLSISGKKISPA